MMMKRFHHIAACVTCVLLTCGVCACWHHFAKRGDDVVLQRTTEETRIQTDTVYVREPIATTERTVRYVPVYFDRTKGEKPDTVVLQDTLLVEGVDSVMIPITQKVYSDSTYTAYVSGYQPSLDSIEVYQRTVYKTITHEYMRNRSRWGIGVQAGYGYNFGGKRFDPYIGVGVTYTIWNF